MYIALINGINVNNIAASGLGGETLLLGLYFLAYIFITFRQGTFFLAALSVQPRVVVRIYPLMPKEKQSSRTAGEDLKQT